MSKSSQEKNTQININIESEVKKLIKNPLTYAGNEEIEKLVNVMKILSHHYYHEGKALVDDSVYDLLLLVLTKRDPKNIFLKQVGAPIDDSRTKVKLPYPLPSLNKVKDDYEKKIDRFIKKYKGPYIISDKLDGISAMIIKDPSSQKVFLYTRGDAVNGQDITKLVKYIFTEEQLKSVTRGTAIRGELIVSLKNYKKIKDDYTTARSAVASAVNSKKVNKTLAKLIDFLAYEVISPRLSMEKQFKMLKKISIKTVNNNLVEYISPEGLDAMLSQRKKETKYEIDGIVIYDSSQIYQLKDSNPKHAFAYKKMFDYQIAESKIKAIEWNVSMYGYLIPKIKIKPVVISRTTITYATAFNAKYICDNNLGPGAVVKIIRSGDVIPYILEVVTPAKEPSMPTVKYCWTDSKVNIFLKNMKDMDSDVNAKKLTHFFKILEVKYLSKGIIAKLIDNGYTDHHQIINFDIEDLSEIDGLGEKIAVKIKKNINKALSKATLPQLMASSLAFGRGFGRRKIKPIIEMYPNILYKKWSDEVMQEKLIEVEGISTISAKQFTKNIDQFKEFIAKLQENNVKIDHIIKKKKKNEIKKTTKLSNPALSEMKILFTGFRDKDLVTYIENNNGKVVSSLSSKTDLLVYAENDKTNNKVAKAKKLKVNVITKEAFIKKYKK